MYVETISTSGKGHFEMVNITDAIRHCVNWLNADVCQPHNNQVGITIFDEEGEEITFSGWWYPGDSATNFAIKIASMLVTAYEGDE